MARCKECIHFGICKKGFPWADGKGGGWCKDFMTSDVTPRAEVAREIFDDIEDYLAVHAFTSKSEDYADGAADTIEWVDSKISELRKKYMGEQI